MGIDGHRGGNVGQCGGGGLLDWPQKGEHFRVALPVRTQAGGAEKMFSCWVEGVNWTCGSEWTAVNRSR